VSAPASLNQYGLVQHLRQLTKRAENGDEQALGHLERWTRLAEKWAPPANRPSPRPLWVRFLLEGEQS
jgi:hypothetical protein